MKKVEWYTFRQVALALTLGVVVTAAMVILAAVLMGGCSTVHQAPVTAISAPLHAPPAKVAGGFIFDSYWRDTYNALISVYGNKKLEDGAPVFVPPLTKDHGLTPLNAEQWFATNEAVQDFVLLQSLKRRGAPP